MKNLTIVGLIPARSGSKGLKSKNLLRIGDETLIGRSTRIALGSKFISDVVFSTDDSGYAEIAQKAGATRVVMRPAELSSDTASSWDVARHAVLTFEEDAKEKIDIVALLQPTTPFRTVSHIDDAIGEIVSGKYEAAMTIREISYPVEWMFYLDEASKAKSVVDSKDKITRRQDARCTYQPSGTVYAVTRSRLFSPSPMVSEAISYVQVPYRESINIDTYDEYVIAKAFYDEQAQ